MKPESLDVVSQSEDAMGGGDGAGGMQSGDSMGDYGIDSIVTMENGTDMDMYEMEGEDGMAGNEDLQYTP